MTAFRQTGVAGRSLICLSAPPSWYNSERIIMRKILGTVFLLIVAGTSDAVGQERGSLGFYIGANTTEFIFANIHPTKFRFGINYSKKLVGPVELYPGLDLIPESFGGGSMWQANIHLRVWPLRRSTNPSFWFVGAGAVVRSPSGRPSPSTPPGAGGFRQASFTSGTPSLSSSRSQTSGVPSVSKSGN